jgi:hypothetical protein
MDLHLKDKVFLVSCVARAGLARLAEQLVREGARGVGVMARDTERLGVTNLRMIATAAVTIVLLAGVGQARASVAARIGLEPSSIERNICTAVSNDVCTAGVPGAAAGQLDLPASVAVDAATGDVYVLEVGPKDIRVDYSKMPSSRDRIPQVLPPRRTMIWRTSGIEGKSSATNDL